MESDELKLEVDEQKYMLLYNTVDSNTLAVKSETNDIKFETVTSDSNILLERTFKAEITNSTSKLDHPNIAEMDSKEDIVYGTSLNFIEQVREGNDQQIEECHFSGMKIEIDELKLEVDEQKYMPLYNTVENNTLALKSETNDIKFEMVTSDDILLERTFKIEGTFKLDPNVEEMDAKEGIVYGTHLISLEQVCKDGDQQIEERHLSEMAMRDIEHVYLVDHDGVDDLAYISDKEKLILNDVDEMVAMTEKSTYDEDKKNVKTSENLNVNTNLRNCKQMHTAKNYVNFLDNKSVDKKDDTRTHSVKKPYKCEVCNKSFSRSNYLISHKRKYSKEKPYKCLVCDKSFRQNVHLTDHMRTHTGEKPYQCDVCKKRFSRKESLVGHMRTHTGERPHKCKVCNKSFSQHCNLTVHMRTHSDDGGRPYKCEVCNKNFREKRYLTKHNMRSHTGEKSYKCEVKGGLIRDMKKHTGEKPFTCGVCNESFNESGHLKDHMSTHTVKLPYECNVCKSSYTTKHDLICHLRTHIVGMACECEICRKSSNQDGHLTGQM